MPDPYPILKVQIKSIAAREFAIALMCYNLEQLGELI